MCLLDAAWNVETRSHKPWRPTVLWDSGEALFKGHASRATLLPPLRPFISGNILYRVRLYRIIY